MSQAQPVYSTNQIKILIDGEEVPGAFDYYIDHQRNQVNTYQLGSEERVAAYHARREIAGWVAIRSEHKKFTDWINTGVEETKSFQLMIQKTPQGAADPTVKTIYDDCVLRQHTEMVDKPTQTAYTVYYFTATRQRAG